VFCKKAEHNDTQWNEIDFLSKRELLMRDMQNNKECLKGNENNVNCEGGTVEDNKNDAAIQDTDP
jgi:hypothetical protein